MIDLGRKVETVPLSDTTGEVCGTVTLVESYGQVQEKNWFGMTPLSNAAEMGNDAVVKLLLAQHDVDVNADGYDGRKPLSRALSGAVYDGHEAVVRLLVARHDIEVNSKDNHGMTPLSIAADMAHETVMRLLLTRVDIEVNSRDNWKQTPLMMAV